MRPRRGHDRRGEAEAEDRKGAILPPRKSAPRPLITSGAARSGRSKRRRVETTTARTTTFHFEKREGARVTSPRARERQENDPRLTRGSKCLVTTILPAAHPECHARGARHDRGVQGHPVQAGDALPDRSRQRDHRRIPGPRLHTDAAPAVLPVRFAPALGLANTFDNYKKLGRSSPTPAGPA